MPGSDGQWLFKSSHLHHTPVVTEDKKTVFHEICQRNSGIEFLFRVGLQLKLNIPVLATAATYFHRFYMRQSIDGHIIYDIAGACIFLACKVEESGRRLKDVAAVCQAKANGTPVIVDEHGPAVTAWMKTITACEEILLETLCFDLTVEHPHNDLLNAAEVLQTPEQLLAYVWSVMNDTFRTPLCVLFAPRVIASASYILCLNWMAPGVPLMDTETGPQAAAIYDAFGLERPHEVAQISEVLPLLLDFYAHIRPHVPEKLWRVNPFAQASSWRYGIAKSMLRSYIMPSGRLSRRTSLFV
ncbi:hypothetical protein BS47DRAFT_914482 [Hydnum rufescens UP504]|uniref:Cyclin-like domain-containing protein n=1 Tax=Hydnum rufescens UP504 TaxID=1448309 RepID=A0A9P6BAK8_9AGAM|nr:hypothetical protein BS47DRAFT_914482 [Hydnum rufescens UP504]